MPGWEVSQRQHCLVHDDWSLVLYVDRGATALSVYVRHLSTDVFEGRAACSRLQRLAHQGEDVVPDTAYGEGSPRGPRGPPCPGSTSRSALAKTYANDALKRRHYRRFLHF